MEKRAIIEEGRTPPEEAGKPLEDHLTKRAADAVTEREKEVIRPADVGKLEDLFPLK